MLGVGGTGIVYELLHKSNGSRFAMKVCVRCSPSPLHGISIAIISYGPRYSSKFAYLFFLVTASSIGGCFFICDVR